MKIINTNELRFRKIESNPSQIISKNMAIDLNYECMCELCTTALKCHQICVDFCESTFVKSKEIFSSTRNAGLISNDIDISN